MSNIRDQANSVLQEQEERILEYLFRLEVSPHAATAKSAGIDKAIRSAQRQLATVQAELNRRYI